MTLSPFSNFFKKISELFDLIITKISSDGGDFQRIRDIALFIMFLFLILKPPISTSEVEYLASNPNINTKWLNDTQFSLRNHLQS